MNHLLFIHNPLLTLSTIDEFIYNTISYILMIVFIVFYTLLNDLPYLYIALSASLCTAFFAYAVKKNIFDNAFMSIFDLVAAYAPIPLFLSLIKELPHGSIPIDIKRYIGSLSDDFSSMELMHHPFATEHQSTFIVLFILPVIGHIALRYWRQSLPPLVYSISIMLLLLGLVFNVTCLFHLLPGLSFTLNPDNAIFVASEELGRELTPDEMLVKPKFALLTFMISAIIYTALSQLAQLHSTYLSMDQTRLSQAKYANSILNAAQRIMLKYPAYANPLFILLLGPLAGLAAIILNLFGQHPDAVIKVFTETSDWGLSQLRPPPTTVYVTHASGMYLCTIALTGHAKLVRPIGIGKRMGKMMPVNRQMLVCNAFEQMLEQSMPRLHRVARKAYDIFCIPFNALAWNKYAADVIYLLMKPLEYFFILVLYCFDKAPEDRIVRQYSYYKDA